MRQNKRHTGSGWLHGSNRQADTELVARILRLFTRENAARAFVGLVALLATGLCANWVYSQYEEVRRQSADIQTRVFRDSVAIFRDLWQIEHILEGMIHSGEITPQDRFEFSQRVDFLFVRTQDLKQNELPDLDARIRIDEVVRDLTDLINAGDAAMASGFSDPQAFIEEIRPALAKVSQDVMELFDSQHIRQHKSIAAQLSIIKRLTVSAIALLCMFASFAAVALFLLQRQLQIQAKRKEAEEKANFLAFNDGLTGLPNRVRFRGFAEELMDENEDPVVFLFDLDDFKLVNDLHGHLAGDAVLLHCAQEIRSWAKEHEGIPARLGGDEFATILPGPISSMKIASICEELITRTSRNFEFEGILLSPKMSIGVAAAWSLETEEKCSLSMLQKAADVALYRAKEQGKNTYAFFDGDLAELVARRREIEIGINDALENGDFTLAFQPQVDLSTGHVRGFEALARWTKDGEPISPGEFVPVAEATGQVVEIDIWGLRESTSVVAGWINEGKMPVSISANLSSLHFRSEEIVIHVARALSDSGLPPHLLTLEITESVLIEDLSKVTVILEKLRELGVKIALDDFGTGYSSLAYLRRLDVDYIKIDQSFVRDLEQSSETQLILDALVDIAKGLNKMLVVEGIETEAQAEIVRKLGCDIGQGYLWGRPIPKSEAVSHVQAVEDALGEEDTA